MAGERLAMRYIVVLLGVGGVGKTTLAYRLMGLSIRPTVTLRPGVYRLYLSSKEVNLIDVPGQYVVEVVQNFARMWTFYVDKAVYMYDVLHYDTLKGARGDTQRASRAGGLSRLRGSRWWATRWISRGNTASMWRLMRSPPPWGPRRFTTSPRLETTLRT